MSIPDNAPIKPRLQQQLPPPPHVNTRAFDCRSFQKVKTLNLVWVGWAIYPDLSSPSSAIHVFYLLTWSCLKVKSLLSQADGSEEKGLQESRGR